MAAATPPALPPRIVPSPLPNLYVYDHCPFCVRVRLLLGLRNVKYNLVFLANDDVQTPTDLVARKITPIFQPAGARTPAFPESLDICKHIDTDPRFGASPLLHPAPPRDAVLTWIQRTFEPMARLSRPRFAQAPLPEFVFRDARDAFARNYPLSDPHGYDANLRRSPEYIATVQRTLPELAQLIHSPHHCSPLGLSYEDILLFPRLRTLTIVKGITFPPKVAHYVHFQAAAAQIPLYYYCAM